MTSEQSMQDHEGFGVEVIGRPEGPQLLDTMTAEEKLTWWEMYDAEFAESNKRSPCRQSFYKDEFMEAMDNPAMSKIGYVKNGEIVALCLLGSDLDQFPWLSKDFYEHNYPEDYQNGNILYFMTLLTKEAHRRNDYASDLIKLLTDLETLGDKEHRVIFDCTQQNAEFLPELIESAINGTGKATIGFEPIGTQVYWAGKISLNQQN